jgi:hypothetical protein
MKLGQAIQMYGNFYSNANSGSNAKVNKEGEDTAPGTPTKADLNNDKGNSGSKQGLRCDRDTLFVLGFTNAQIDQYFITTSARTLGGNVKDVCELRSGIVIDGKEITDIDGLISALGITSDSNKTETNTLGKWLEMNEQYNPRPSGVNESPSKGDVEYKKGLRYDRDTLFVLGFSNAQIDQYFNTTSARTLGGSVKDVCELRSGIVIDGKEITDIHELISALDITSNSNRTGSNTLGARYK